MATTDATTDNFEGQLQAALHGQNIGASLDDPNQYEVGLFTADPTDSASLTNELSTSIGYERKSINLVAGSGADAGKLVSEADVSWAAGDATGTATAAWIGVFKKREYTLSLADTGTQNIWLPSLTVENVSTGTVTDTLQVDSADDLLPHLEGTSVLRLVDSSASFPSTSVDENFLATHYVIITSGLLRGMKIPVLRTEDSTSLTLDMYGYTDSADLLNGCTYILRKSPTVATVFGAGGTVSDGDAEPEVNIGTGTSSTADLVYFKYAGPSSIMLENVTIDDVARTVSWTNALTSAQQDRIGSVMAMRELESSSLTAGAGSMATIKGITFDSTTQASFPEGIAQVDTVTITAGDITAAGGATYSVTIDSTTFTVTEGSEINNGDTADDIATALAGVVNATNTGMAHTTAEAGTFTLTASTVGTAMTVSVATTDTGAAAIAKETTTESYDNDLFTGSSEAYIRLDLLHEDSEQKVHFYQVGPTFSGGNGWRALGASSSADAGSDQVLPIHDLHFGGNRIDVGGGYLFAGYGDPSPLVGIMNKRNSGSIIYYATEGLASELLWRAEITDPSTGSANALTFSSANTLTFSAGSIKFYVS